MIIRVSELPRKGSTIDDAAALGVPVRRPVLAARRRRSSASTPDGTRRGRAAAGVAATVPQVCGRCLESFPVAVRAPTSTPRLVPRPATGDSVELATTISTTDFYANDQLDLTALVETETTLALAHEAAVPHGLPGALSGVRRQPQPRSPAPARRDPPDPRLAALRGLSATRDH